MPLKKGYSRKSIGSNSQDETKSGKSRKAAERAGKPSKAPKRKKK